MKLVWCPETASKAYIDAVKALADCDLPETSVAEFVAATAGGWKSQLVVEAWSRDDGDVATGVGLQAATRHANGRHVCIVSDQPSATEYAEAMRRAGASMEAQSVVVVREVEEVMRGLEGVDLMVVDRRRRDAGRVLREARPGLRGMVVICKGAGWRRGGAAALLGSGRRVVRSTFLPLGSGMEVLHVGVGKGPSLGGGRTRWIRHVDSNTKEEHVFRR